MIKHTEESSMRRCVIVLTSGFHAPGRIGGFRDTGSRHLASGCRSIRPSDLVQRRRQIWRVRMNGSALRSACSGEE